MGFCFSGSSGLTRHLLTISGNVTLYLNGAERSLFHDFLLRNCAPLRGSRSTDLAHDFSPTVKGFSACCGRWHDNFTHRQPARTRNFYASCLRTANARHAHVHVAHRHASAAFVRHHCCGVFFSPFLRCLCRRHLPFIYLPGMRPSLRAPVRGLW